MNACIVLTGDELMEGRVADTNGAFIARRLTDLGVKVEKIVFVGDDMPKLVAAFKEAHACADIVACSGGLGGTKDDLTRDALAIAFDRPLEHHDLAAANVEAFFARLKRPAFQKPWLEALAPRGTTILDNAVGIAPGLLLHVDGRSVFAFPGVPAELECIIDAGAFERVCPRSAAYRRADIGFSGWRESDAAKALGELLDRDRNPLIGIGAKEGVLMLHVRSRGRTPAEAVELLTRDVDKIRAVFGRSIYTIRGESLQEAVVRMLHHAGKTLAIAESLTGGLIGHSLTEIPGVSAVLMTSVVAYTPAMKTALLGVDAALIRDNNVVSRETAVAMAQGVLSRSGADFAIATTGIAGPTGGDAERPIGTAWVACVDRAGNVAAETRVHPGTRTGIKKRVAVHAIDLLRRFLGDRGLDAVTEES